MEVEHLLLIRYFNVIKLNFFIIYMAKLLPKTTYFTERLFRVHPKSLVTMLIAAPTKVSFQNNFLGTLAYLTPLSI